MHSSLLGQWWTSGKMGKTEREVTGLVLGGGGAAPRQMREWGEGKGMRTEYRRKQGLRKGPGRPRRPPGAGAGRSLAALDEGVGELGEKCPFWPDCTYLRSNIPAKRAAVRRAKVLG